MDRAYEISGLTDWMNLVGLAVGLLAAVGIGIIWLVNRKADR